MSEDRLMKASICSDSDCFRTMPMIAYKDFLCPTFWSNMCKHLANKFAIHEPTSCQKSRQKYCPLEGNRADFGKKKKHRTSDKYETPEVKGGHTILRPLAIMYPLLTSGFLTRMSKGFASKTGRVAFQWPAKSNQSRPEKGKALSRMQTNRLTCCSGPLSLVESKASGLYTVSLCRFFLMFEPQPVNSQKFLHGLGRIPSTCLSESVPVFYETSYASHSWTEKMCFRIFQGPGCTVQERRLSVKVARYIDNISPSHWYCTQPSWLKSGHESSQRCFGACRKNPGGTNFRYVCSINPSDCKWLPPLPRGR